MFVRFGGTFSPDDLATLDELSDTFIAAERPASILYDFSDVECVAMPPEMLVSRASRPQFCSHLRRAVVAPQAEIYGLVRIYGAYQSAAGFSTLMMATSVPEALELLEVEQPSYEPVAESWVVAVEAHGATAAMAH